MLNKVWKAYRDRDYAALRGFSHEELQDRGETGVSPAERAAQDGNLEMLEFLHKNGTISEKDVPQLVQSARAKRQSGLADNLEKNGLEGAIHPNLHQAMEGPFKAYLPEELQKPDALKDPASVMRIQIQLDKAIADMEQRVANAKDLGPQKPAPAIMPEPEAEPKSMMQNGLDAVKKIPDMITGEGMQEAVKSTAHAIAHPLETAQEAARAMSGTGAPNEPVVDERLIELSERLRQLKEARAEAEGLYKGLDAQRKDAQQQDDIRHRLDTNHDGVITRDEIERYSSGATPTARENLVRDLENYRVPVGKKADGRLEDTKTKDELPKGRLEEGMNKDELILVAERPRTQAQIAEEDRAQAAFEEADRKKDFIITQARIAVGAAVAGDEKKKNEPMTVEQVEEALSKTAPGSVQREIMIERLQAAQKASPGFITDGNANEIIASVQAEENRRIALNMADRDKNGKISAEEALAELKRAGTGSKFEKILNAAPDNILDGFTKAEAVAAAKADKAMKEYIDRFDGNGDGIVTQQERLERMNIARNNVDKDNLRQVIDAAKDIDPSLLEKFNSKFLQVAESNSKNLGGYNKAKGPLERS